MRRHFSRSFERALSSQSTAPGRRRAVPRHRSKWSRGRPPSSSTTMPSLGLLHSRNVHYKDRVTGAPGIYFRPITRHAPVLEYSRHPITASNPAVAGRLYWSKFFVSQPDQVTYEISAFEAWYSHVARWVRKHGTQIPHGDTTPWCLPGARRALAP